jgi:hypothetical protein
MDEATQPRLARPTSHKPVAVTSAPISRPRLNEKVAAMRFLAPRQTDAVTTPALFSLQVEPDTA